MVLVIVHVLKDIIKLQTHYYVSYAIQVANHVQIQHNVQHVIQLLNYMY